MELAAQYPDLCNCESIGQSVRGREIILLKIGHGSQNVLVEGGIHGNEKVGPEMCYMWADYLVENQDSPVVDFILMNSSQYIVPMVNPDGHELGTRQNANMVDVNRNFGFYWEGCDDTCIMCMNANKGGSAFSEPESQAMRNLVAQVAFSMAISYHAGSEKLLYPWGYTKNRPLDYNYFTYVSSLVNQEIEKRGYPPYYAGQTSWEGEDGIIVYDYMGRSWILYCCSGTSKDYYYSEGVFTWVLEISNAYAPPYEEIPYYFQRQLPLLLIVSFEAIGGLPPPLCEDITNQSECENAGCYWYNNSCHSSPPPEECQDYTSQSACETAGCYWWSDNTCHSTAEPPPPPPCNEGDILYRGLNKYKCINGEWVLVDSGWPMIFGIGLMVVALLKIKY